MQLIEVKAIAPFVGTYVCPLAEADLIDDVLEEKDGMTVKTRVPKKRFAGFIDVQRRLSPEEIQRALEGELPANIELLDPAVLKSIKPGAQNAPEVFAIEHAPTVMLPADVAAGLIERGLAGKIETKRGRG